MSRDVLNKLATKYVGDPKTKLVFVTDDEGTLAVFYGSSFLPDAKKIADTFVNPCWVETKDGIEYDNLASRRRQREEEVD